ncbi:sialidase family protein [Kineosporia succinea]|uniref:exo-alpha-sialidase n=1 Tax=Kineosporia succinea TaxID=84632 RepID=A0ABT9P2H7_9ACTN|nr:sialidase family protein [Kineosporia succinea]MDP9826886.1 sialidase-1 [Kineosporia succinea]
MTRSSSIRRLVAGLAAVAGLALVAPATAEAAPTPAGSTSSSINAARTCSASPFVSRPSKKLWYRIPSLVRTPKGTLVAFAEARDNNDASDMGNYDIATSRSTDNGCSWSAPKVIASDGANRVASPSALVDADTGNVMVLSAVSVRENSGGQGKGLYLQTSTDDGRTFSPLLSNPLQGFKGGLAGPGHGIQLKVTHTGRLLYPIAYKTKEGLYGGYGIYSDDHGKTWHTGYHQLDTSGKHDWIEGTAAELKNGDIFLSYRERIDQAPAGTAREWAISTDGGETLSGPGFAGSRLPIVSVQGSALTPTGTYGNLLLFTAPGDRTRNLRRDMSIFVSSTGGKTWRSRYQLELHSTPGAYSDITQIGTSVGVLYETGTATWKERISFLSVPLSQVVSPTKVASKLTFYRNAKPVPTSQNAKAQVKVTVKGTQRPPGRVTLTATSAAGQKRSAFIDFTYSNKGSRWVTLPRLGAGRYKLTLTYSGTGRIKGAVVSAGTLRVVK